ncbi:hypothetical protein A5707_03955 [Mycobacterium kyorinense]|uniref:Uncharacterized protein n=1 Tax=Mycobacterium kyorinense TaxID=487514 RepID=A0A1A2Z370_9MYCO|nr:hypothetical protein A5707_03955 [Mycobacterium kyorinense]
MNGIGQIPRGRQSRPIELLEPSLLCHTCEHLTQHPGVTQRNSYGIHLHYRLVPSACRLRLLL